MKAVRGIAGEVQLVDVDDAPGNGELLTMKSVSICSSDFLYLTFGTTLVVGHELAGVTADGTAMMVDGLYGCGECELCHAGRPNLCSAMGGNALGASIDGGMVEQFRAPRGRLVEVPHGLDVRDACLVDAAAVSWHALNLGNAGPGRRVGVVGAGALGLMAVAGAKHMGVEEVGVEARHPHQREATERLGGTVGVNGLYDVVIEAAGSPESMSRALEMVAPRGVVVVLGVYMGTVSLDWGVLFNKEASVVPSLGYCQHNGTSEMIESAKMLAANAEIPRTLITHRFPIEDAVEAFRVAGDRTTGAIRVVVEPT